MSLDRLGTLAPARALLACTLAIAIAGATAATAPRTAPAATGIALVDMQLIGATVLVNDCTAPSAAGFGTVQPLTNAITDTGAGVCRVTFGGSAATQLRVGQSDGTGTAMGLGILAPTQLTGYQAPGRTLGVFGIDANTAFAVGRAGTGYRTTDGGATWDPLLHASYPSGNNWDVESTPGNPAHLWVVGDGARFHHSTNANTATAANVSFVNRTAQLTGTGWPASVDTNELSIPDNDTIYVVGESRWLARYDISAQTFASFQHANASVGSIVSVDAASPTNAMAASTTGYVLHTSTGTMNSASWTATALPNAPDEVTDVAMASTSRAYAVGFDGYLAVWDGSSWTDRTASIALPRDIHAVDSLPGSPDTVLALDESGIVHVSTDAGLTWSHAATESASSTGDIHAATASDVYSTGAERSHSASHDGAASFTTYGPSASEELSAIAAAPLDGRRILAVGDSAYRSTDAGGSWTSASTGTARAIRGVSLASDSAGWAVGDSATIRYTDDLGATWTSQAAPGGTGSLTDVVARDDVRAIAVGFDGRVIGTANGGSSWTARTSGTTKHLTGVASHLDLMLAAGADGTILRSTDSGDTWTAIPGGSVPSTTDDLLDVAIAGPDTAYAVTRHDVWRSTDAGLTWTVASTLGSTRIRAVGARGRTVVVVGFDDRVEYSTDDGDTFTGTSAGTSGMHLSSIAMVDSHTAVIGAADRRRLRMDVDPAAAATVSDWTATTNDWDSGDFFGVCLQEIGGIAIADWTEDNLNAVNQCEMLDSDPWRAVPAAAAVAAHTAAAGNGTVDLVWGLRPRADQRPGTYEAGISFEAMAP